MKKHLTYLIIILSVQRLCAQQPKGHIVLEAFPYGVVKLDDSPLKRQLDRVKAYYLRIPNDDLLKGFRQRSGLPVHGAQNMGGWYSNDVFHNFGQLLSGYSRLYATTGDEACRDKLNALISGWAETIDSTGYFFYSGSPHAPHYVYEKMVGGLVDAYVFADNEEALKHLSTITDWAIKHLNKTRGFAFASVGVSNEWYTLSENLYRAWLVTNDKKYYDFAEFWEYNEYWDLYANEQSIFDKDARYHAYSHLNTLSSAAAAYLVKGKAKYKAALENAYNFFRQKQCYATGGFGTDERLLPKDELVEALRTSHNSFETQCGSWAAFKLSKYLIAFTGDGRYGDWVERLMINGIGADIPMSADGRVLYYSDYNPREGAKKNYFKSWSCCTGTRPQAVAEYADLVYFKNKSGLYVNLYTPSHLAWNDITLTQRTSFPENNETTFEIDVIGGKARKSFGLHFRKPSWTQKSPEVYLNGKEIEIEQQNGWLYLNRKWKDGDQVKLVFPMGFSISRLDEDQKYPAAITYGPVVMAIRTGNARKYPETLLETENLWEKFIPVPGEPLTYHVKNMPDLLIRPYYRFEENEPYIMYIDPSVKNRVLDRDIKTTGNWLNRGYYHSRQKGATIATTFKGKGIRLYLNRFPAGGKFKVEIDGRYIETIDAYSAKVHGNFEKEYKNLDHGNHTIILTVLGEKSEESRNYFAYVTGFEVIE